MHCPSLHTVIIFDTLLPFSRGTNFPALLEGSDWSKKITSTVLRASISSRKLPRKNARKQEVSKELKDREALPMSIEDADEEKLRSDLQVWLISDSERSRQMLETLKAAHAACDLVAGTHACVCAYIHTHIYIYASELVGCPPFFSQKASWLSTFFFPIFPPHVQNNQTICHSRLAHETSVTNHLSRPAGCPPTSQLVVHQNSSNMTKKRGQPGCGQPAGLQMCVCRPQITIIVTSKKHHKNRYFVPTHKKSTTTYTKFSQLFFNPLRKKKH